MTVIRATNWQALMMLSVMPMAPSWGGWNCIFMGSASKSVKSFSVGRSLLAVRMGNRGLGNGAVGSSVEGSLVEMLGNLV
jgi:hypothetical protein